MEKNNTNVCKKVFSFILLGFVFHLLACSGDDVSPTHQLPKHLFTVESNVEWRMKNDNNHTAYFQSLDTTIISIANVFWDTSKQNRIEMKAIPVRFRYWEGNLQKNIMFAFGITDSGYVFCADRNNVISDFALDGFYSKLFFIPNDISQNEFTEYAFEDFPFGITTYRVSTETRWINDEEIIWEKDMQKLWKVRYKSTHERKMPTEYHYSFDFLQNIGFYSYMNYQLVEKLALSK